MAADSKRRMPSFAWDYFVGGIGLEAGLARNRQALNDVLLQPRYLTGVDEVDYHVDLFGQSFDAPFGVAPIGLGGLMWPRAAEFLSRSAARNNIPFALSTYATSSLETIAKIAGPHAWFQLYPVNRTDVEADLIRRAEHSGYQTMIVTVDIPTTTVRERDVKNGLAVPPELMDWRTALRILARPRWALTTALSGIPAFENLTRYAPQGASLRELGIFLDSLAQGSVNRERLQKIRDRWRGNLIVKGILDPQDAKACVDIGVDGVVVSNHGGRQLDAAPASISVLPSIREAVGDRLVIMADGGIRSGLDVARMLASGADFVLLGRAFMFGVSAIGERGGDHAAGIIKEELRQTMVQLGCPNLQALPTFLHTPAPSRQ